MKHLEHLPGIKHRNSKHFCLIAGPCVIESEDMALPIARKIVSITNRYQVPFIFKASYRKANRSKLDSFTGIGDEKALNILKHIRNELNIPVITDIHNPEEAEIASEYVDILQIPAFLCRQTELLAAAAKTGKIVNVKKGQFLNPEATAHIIKKIKDSGNEKIWLTERGTTFGYQDLVVDFRSIPKMQQQGAPVILDVTHSLQQPNQSSGVTGGQPDMIETIAKAGIAAGADGIFIETHPDPSDAKSDGANMLQLDKLEDLIEKLVKINEATIS